MVWFCNRVSANLIMRCMSEEKRTSAAKAVEEK